MSGRGLRIGIVALAVLLIAAASASAQTITRDLPDSVAPGETFQVTLTISDLGNNFIGFREIVPAGFTIDDVSYDPNNANVEVDSANNTILITATGDQVITYTLTAPSQEGTYTFSAEVVWGSASLAGDSSLTVTTTPTPVSTVNYYVRDITFEDTTSGASLTIKDVPLISFTNQWVLTFYGEDISIDYPRLGASSVEIHVVDISSGEVKRYTDVKTIPASDLVAGKQYDIVITWYDSDGNQIDQIDIANGNTFNRVTVSDIGTVQTASAVIVIARVPQKPTISISVDGSPATEGDQVIFKVDIDNFDPTTMYWVWVLQGPYYGQRLTGGPFTTSSADVPIDTGDLVVNRNGQKGTYKLVVVVYNSAGNALNYGVAKWELQDLDIDIVAPKDSKIGNKIRVVAVTNAAKTNSKYDIGTPNTATIIVNDSNGNTLRSWTNVPIKDGRIESPLPILLHPSLPTGSYQVTVIVTTYSGITEDETKYFVVSDATVEFDMDLSYVRGEEIKFKGETSLFTEQPPSATNYMWIFITPEPDPCDVNAWFVLDEFGQWYDTNGDGRIDNSELAQIPQASLTTVPQEGFFRLGTCPDGRPMVGLLAVVDADRTFKTPKYHIDENASFVSYTFRGTVAYWDRNTNSMKLSTYSGTVTIRVAKERIELSIEPAVAAKGMYVKLSGKAPRDDDVVFVFTNEPDVFNKVPRIPREDDRFTRTEVVGNLYAISTDENGEFSTMLQVSRTADPDTYIIYVIQPADRSYQVFDPTTDALGMITITIREFGFINVPTTFEMVQGDERDLMVQIFGDPDDVQATMDIKGHGLSVRDYPLVKYNESEDGSTGWLYTTLYTFYDVERRQLTSRFIDYDHTVPLKPGSSYVIHLELKDRTGTVDEVDIVWTIKPIEMKVTMPSEVVAGDKLVIKIDTNHRSKSYDDVHVIVDLGTGILRKYLYISLDKNGDATVEIDTSGWEPGKTVTVWIRDRAKTYFTQNTPAPYAIPWDWDQHYDFAPVGKGEVDYSALKAVAAHDDWVEKRPVKVLASAPTTETTTTTTATTVTTTTTTTTTTEVTTTTTTTEVVTTTTPGGGIPGFEAIFAIAGLLAVAYLLRRQ